MRNKLLFITMLFGLILIPKEVLAASLGLSCPSSVTVGENITCTLTANHETISGVKGSLSFSARTLHTVEIQIHKRQICRATDGAYHTKPQCKRFSRVCNSKRSDNNRLFHLGRNEPRA